MEFHRTTFSMTNGLRVLCSFVSGIASEYIAVVLLGPSGSEADLAFSTALLCWANRALFLVWRWRISSLLDAPNVLRSARSPEDYQDSRQYHGTPGRPSSQWR